MTDVTQVRAEEIEGLRALISQVIMEERERLLPTHLLQDVEKIRQSPAGAVIRIEEGIVHF